MKRGNNAAIKVIIKGSHYNKEEVLDAFANLAAQNTIIPVLYKNDGEDTCFLFQNGISTVKILASSGLLLPLNDNIKLCVNLQLEHCPYTDVPVDVMKLIEKVISKRTNRRERIVDLRNFVSDTAFKDIYAPLTSYAVNYLAIRIIKRILPRPSIILLNHNNLQDGGFIEALRIFNPSLKGLDLRHNKFTWDVFQKFTNLKITDLWIDGNPICDYRIYSSVYVVNQVKKIFPQVTKLDNIDVSTPPVANIVPLKNYISQNNYTVMIDHFLHHYFNLYESASRGQLDKIYHPKATLSISCCNLGNSTTSNVGLNEYLKVSRNMLTVSDMCRMYSTQRRSPKDIMDTLNNLPNVIFDQYSFNVDVPITREDVVVINVCGVFKDFSTLNPGCLFSFDRTFILQPWPQVLGEWKVVNDIWVVTNTTTAVADASFTQPRKSLMSDFTVMINNKNKDKDVLQRMVSHLAGMNGVWTLKFLSESNWDLEMALQAFTDQFKANQIPPEAFTASCVNMESEAEDGSQTPYVGEESIVKHNFGRNG
ncbi:nuclear RNA export factor 2-like isoform X2 [Rhodnius prolixus]